MKLKMPIAFGILCAAVAVPAFAHHSFGMFELQKDTEYV